MRRRPYYRDIRAEARKRLTRWGQDAILSGGVAAALCLVLMKRRKPSSAPPKIQFRKPMRHTKVVIGRKATTAQATIPSAMGWIAVSRPSDSYRSPEASFVIFGI